MKEGNDNTGGGKPEQDVHENLTQESVPVNDAGAEDTIGSETDTGVVSPENVPDSEVVSPDAQDAGNVMPPSSSPEMSRREKKAEEKRTRKEAAARQAQEQKEARHRIYPNWIDLLAILGFFLVAALVAAIVSMPFNRINGIDQGAVNAIMYFVQMGATILFVVLHRRARKAQSVGMKFSLRKLNLPLILWGILLTVVVGVVIEPLMALMPDKFMEYLNSSIGTGGWAILTTVILAPILEEVLFRGYIQGAIEKKAKSPWTAILISAAIFGIIHLLPQQALNAFFCGIVLGYVYYKTHSIASVIIMHLVNNALAYIQMELLGPENAAMYTRDILGNDPLYFIIYGVCAALLVVGIVGMVRSLRPKNELVADSEL